MTQPTVNLTLIEYKVCASDTRGWRCVTFSSTADVPSSPPKENIGCYCTQASLPQPPPPPPHWIDPAGRYIYMSSNVVIFVFSYTYLYLTDCALNWSGWKLELIWPNDGHVLLSYLFQICLITKYKHWLVVLQSSKDWNGIVQVMWVFFKNILMLNVRRKIKK